MVWGRGRVTGVLAWRLGSCEDRHPFAPPRTCFPLGPHISLVSLRGRPALGALLSRSWSLGGDPLTLTPTVGDGGVRRVCVGPSTRLRETCGWNWRGGRAVVSRPLFPHPHMADYLASPFPVSACRPSAHDAHCGTRVCMLNCAIPSAMAAGGEGCCPCTPSLATKCMRTAVWPLPHSPRLTARVRLL